MARRIAWLWCGLAAASALAGTIVRAHDARPATVVAVVAGSDPADPAAHGGLLVRELARQAVLLAARQELRLATRDAALREPVDEKGALQLDVRIAAVPGKEMVIELRQVQRPTDRALATFRRALPAGESFDYLALTAFAEELSRGPIVEALRQAGLPTTVPGRAGDAKPAAPPHVEKHLQRMSFLDQYAAVRTLHAAARRDGDSPAVLAGLVRGYANLAILTEMQFDTSHKVFAARAMLYAQRLVARESKSALAHWHRAFALALAGLHRAALADLDAAKKLDSNPPAWVKLVDALCRFDAQRLPTTPRADDPLAETRLMFRILVDEFDVIDRSRYEYPETAQVNAAVRAIHQQLPHCDRVRREAVGRGMATAERQSFPADWYAHARRSLTVPAAVARLLEELSATVVDAASPARQVESEFAGRARLLSALRDAASTGQDTGEPSLGVLATLVEETTFADAWDEAGGAGFAYRDRSEHRRTIDNFRRIVMTSLAAHPLLPVLEERVRRNGNNPAKTNAEVDRLFNRWPMHYVAWQAWEWLVDYHTEARPEERATKAPSSPVVRAAARHSDDTYRDLTMSQMVDVVASPERQAERLFHVSPLSPSAAVCMTQLHWPRVKSLAAGWETRFAENLDVQGTLALKYLEERRYDDARRCFSRFAELAPTAWAHLRLAETFKLAGDTKRWLETLEEFLHSAGEEVNRGEIRRQIAQHFLARRDYQRAAEYAQRAFDDGAEDAAAIAAHAHEALRNWLLAERYYRNAADSYPSRCMHWYSFCRRTGQGDVNAARAAAWESIRAARHDQPDEANELLAEFFLLDGEPREALPRWQRAFDKQHLVAGLHVVALATEFSQSARRQALWQQLATLAAREPGRNDPTGTEDQRRIRELAKLLHAAYGGKSRGRLDAAAIERLASGAEPEVAATLHYFVGRFLELDRQSQAALDHYRRCVATRAATLPVTLASMRLRSHGFEPGE